MTSIVRPKRGPAKGFPKKARSRLKARLAHEGFLVPLAKLPRLVLLDVDSRRFVPKNPPFGYILFHSPLLGLFKKPKYVRSSYFAHFWKAEMILNQSYFIHFFLNHCLEVANLISSFALSQKRTLYFKYFPFAVRC